MRLILLLLALMILISGCADRTVFADTKRYEASFLTLFDTVTTIVGYAASEEQFRKIAEKLHDELLEYHQLFDIYHTYPDIANLKTVNDSAGITAVKVDPRIIDLLLFCKEAHERTGGLVNAAMGSVLSLWRDARASALPPDLNELKKAAEHTDFSSVIIDPAAGTVFLSDPEARLDVGAIAKGYAAQKVSENAPAGLLFSIGGNVCATGSRPDSFSPWTVGIQSPDKQDAFLHMISLEQGCVVTSGDYQRYFFYNGKRYHHIIHPETLMPYEAWRCVTVLCKDSAVADILSTALFLTSYEEGLALLEIYDAEAMWMDQHGMLYYSEHFTESIKT